MASGQHCVPEPTLMASLERFWEAPPVESFCTQPSRLQRSRSAQRCRSTHASASSVGAVVPAELAEAPWPGYAAHPRGCAALATTSSSQSLASRARCAASTLRASVPWGSAAPSTLERKTQAQGHLGPVSGKRLCGWGVL